MPIIARDINGQDHSVRSDDEGYIIVKFFTKYEVKWETKIDFDKGSY